MGGADVGDHRNIRLGAVGQTGDLSGATHAHLNHQGSGVAAGPQHREGNADVVVVVTFTGLDWPQRGQGSTDQLAGRGFPGRAGHGHQRSSQLMAMQQGQLLVGRQGVVHPPVQQFRRQRVRPAARHDSRLGLSCRQLLQKGMAVEAFAHQRNEEITGSDATAVRADGPDGLIRIHRCAEGRSPEFDQLPDQQGHAAGTELNRIMPAPTRAERPIRRSSESTNCNAP